MENKCCCRKYKLKDDEVFVHNGIQHELYGDNKFCGPVKDHKIKDLEICISKLKTENRKMKITITKQADQIAELKRLLDAERR